MVEVADKSVWYRIYVLLVLLLVCVCSLATRNIPSYLVTVPVPECEDLCSGVAAAPICGPVSFPEGRPPTQYEVCQLCRARVLPAESLNTTAPLVRPQGQEASGGRVRRSQRSDRVGAGLLAAEEPQAEAPFDGDSPVVYASGGGGVSVAQLREGPLSSFGYEDIPWASTVNKDAGFYNLADGACLHHWQYGILIGYGFALIFAVGSVPAGFVCDYKSRVLIASASLFTWSVATSLQAAGHSFIFMLGCRAVIGLSQAFALPAAISLAADYFADKQNFAVALLSVGLYLGSGCASFSILFAEVVGWRWAVLIAGLFGMALTPVLYLTVQEPDRTEWSAPCRLSIVREEVLDNSRIAPVLIFAGSAKMLAAYSLSAFLPIWYSRRGLVGYTAYSYACWNALIISGGGLLSAALGGIVGQRWGERDSRAPCWIGMIGALCSIPLVILVLQTPRFDVSMLCLFLLILVGESWYGPTLTLLQASVRRSVQGQAVSMFLVLSTLAGTFGPALVGFLDPGTDRIGLHLLWISVAANVIAMAMFLSVAREITVDPVAAGVGGKAGEALPGTSGNRICWTVF